MYRATASVGRQCILRTRSQPANARGVLRSHVQTRVGRRFMSTEAEGGSSGGSSILKPLVGLLAVGGGVTAGAALNDEFRGTVEEYVPGAQVLFGVVIPRSTTAPPVVAVVEDLPSLLKKPAVTEEIPTETAVIESEVAEEAPVEAVVEETIAAPVEVVVEETIAAEAVASDEVPAEVVEEVVLTESEQVSAEVVESVAEVVVAEEIVVEEPLAEEAVIEEPATVTEVSASIEETPVQAEEPVEEVVAAVDDAEEFVVIENTPEVDTEAVTAQTLQQEIERQTQILTTEYENLRIILDDTITTKSSAVRMLHGYITQFSQALLVVRHDPAYTSIWDAILAVGHSIHDSIELVKTKEMEVQSQVVNINGVITDLRTHGKSEFADRAEKLISASNEQLTGCQTEMTKLNKIAEILAGLRERIDSSPDRLQNYLRGFIPDLMKLLTARDVESLESLSTHDALLLLSLQRPTLVYAEQEVKDAEKKAEFEVLLEQQKEDVLKEAESHLASVVEQVTVERTEELEVKVQELKQEFAQQLQTELKSQHETHRRLRAEEGAKLEAELAAQHLANLEVKLAEQQVEHQHVVDTNLSSISAIESKITDVLHMEKRSQKNQHLWAAAHALYNSLNDIAGDGRTQKLASELPNILQCDENDTRLAQIVSAVPERAAATGIIPESVLIQNFKEKKQLCKQVAAVEGTDQSFFVFAFSILKSYFVPSKWMFYGQLPEDADLTSLTAYEILERADYYVSTGDLERACLLMSQLRGVARQLCGDWVEEVRLLLETKQATDLLMAYVGSLVVGLE